MFALEGVSFAYAAGTEGGALHAVDLRVPDGQAVLVCGESGCGKTTLLRLMNGLIPHYYEGALEGRVSLEGRDMAALELYDVAEKVGSVFQNPKSQFFTLDAASEVAFGCENLGLPVADIACRVRLAARELRLADLMGRSLFSLSGGEKQKVACASVHAMGPRALVLDEPASNLDGAAIADLHDILLTWKAQGRTIVVAEHRLAYLMDVVDRVVCLRAGRIVVDKGVDEFLRTSPQEVAALGLRPLSPKLQPAPAHRAPPAASASVLALSEFAFSYPGVTEPALAVDRLVLPANQVIGVVGRNGAGKSTFARCLCGLEDPPGARLVVEGESLDAKERLRRCFMVMQDVNCQLFTESVLGEVLLSLPRRSRSEDAAYAILADLNLAHKLDAHPMSLSGGERQRLAIASALASARRVIVFDEPTSGLDFRHMVEVVSSLEDLRTKGASVLVVTHDPELLCRSCTHILCLERGKVAWTGPMGAEALERVERLFDGEGREAICAESRECPHGCSRARGGSS